MAINPFNPAEINPNVFHNPLSITFGELIEDGEVDWNDEFWTWDFYDREQYQRVNNLIENHFYDREIGCLPVSRWHRHFIRLINEIMPTLKPLYEIADKNKSIFLSDSDVYSKSRDVFSDFPATQLVENQDYASNATDHENEILNNGNFMDNLKKIEDEYISLDMVIIRRLESCFSSIITVNMNAF